MNFVLLMAGHGCNMAILSAAHTYTASRKKKTGVSAAPLCLSLFKNLPQGPHLANFAYYSCLIPGSRGHSWLSQGLQEAEHF